MLDYFSDPRNIFDERDVTTWSKERILEAVRDKVGKNLVSPLIQHKIASAHDARPQRNDLSLASAWTAMPETALRWLSTLMGPMASSLSTRFV